MDIGTGIAILGAALVGAKILNDKKGDVAPEAKPEATTTLGKNADAMGFERIAEGEALEPGKVQTVTDSDGNIIGEMAETEGGVTVFQKPDGTTRTFTEGEPIFDTAPEETPAVATPQTTNSIMSYPAPKTPITTSLQDARISALRASGFTFRL